MEMSYLQFNEFNKFCYFPSNGENSQMNRCTTDTSGQYVSREIIYRLANESYNETVYTV